MQENSFYFVLHCIEGSRIGLNMLAILAFSISKIAYLENTVGQDHSIENIKYPPKTSKIYLDQQLNEYY